MNEQTDNAEEAVSFKQYIPNYITAFFWAFLAIILFNSFIFKVSAPMGMLITIVCTGVVANKFTNNEQRLFTKREKRRFSIASVLLSSLLTITFIGLFAASKLYHLDFQVEEVFRNLANKTSLGLLAGLTAFVALLQYVAHYIFYGMFNKTALKQVLERIGEA